MSTTRSEPLEAHEGAGPLEAHEGCPPSEAYEGPTSRQCPSWPQLGHLEDVHQPGHVMGPVSVPSRCAKIVHSHGPVRGRSMVRLGTGQDPLEL